MSEKRLSGAGGGCENCRQVRQQLQRHNEGPEMLWGNLGTQKMSARAPCELFECGSSQVICA